MDDTKQQGPVLTTENKPSVVKQSLDQLEDDYTPCWQVGYPSEVTPKDRLNFAIGSLLTISAMFCTAAACYIFIPSESSKEVFEASKTILPPIALMILGAYFSKGSS